MATLYIQWLSTEPIPLLHKTLVVEILISKLFVRKIVYTHCESYVACDLLECFTSSTLQGCP